MFLKMSFKRALTQAPQIWGIWFTSMFTLYITLHIMLYAFPPLQTHHPLGYMVFHSKILQKCFNFCTEGLNQSHPHSRFQGSLWSIHWTQRGVWHKNAQLIYGLAKKPQVNYFKAETGGCRQPIGNQRRHLPTAVPTLCLGTAMQQDNLWRDSLLVHVSTTCSFKTIS